MIKHKMKTLAAAVALGLAGRGLVEACGIYFPTQLNTRHATLREAVPFQLAEELARLDVRPLLDAKSAAALAIQAKEQGRTYADDDALEHIRKRQIEIQDQVLDAGQRERLAQMRKAEDGDAAYALGEGLPPAVRLYAAAAVDYRIGERKAQALERFEKILALPEREAKPRAVWAAYSIGRLLRTDDAEAAARAYGQSRVWLLKGAADPLGLAVDSLGEEAWMLRHPSEGGTADVERALRLYLEQARLGSWSGVASLQELQRSDLFEDAELIGRLLGSDWGQALLVRLAIDDNDRDEAKRRYKRLAGAVAALDQGQLREGDRWAALAWQHGDLEHARAWLTLAPSTALAAWMRAKFAVLSGKDAEATRHYAEALKLMRPDGSGTSRHRFDIELGVYQVQRGDFVQGLQHLYRAGPDHWFDIAHIADRLLTIEELQKVAPVLAERPATAEVRSLAPHLRHLLARRLMRAGRFADAVPLFPADYVHERWNGKDWDKQIVDLAKLASDYASALAAADKAWTRIGRAVELMRAARIARAWGLELMGFEFDGDAFAHRGNYDFRGDFDKIDGPLPRAEGKRMDASLQTLAMTTLHGEKGLPRFHYRYVAAEHAIQAAELVPPRSQAYASLLCHGAMWTDNRVVDKLYERYVKHGAAIPDMTAFGGRCPEPSWSGAARLQVKETLRDAAPWLHRHPYRSAGAAALIVAAAIAALIVRRRRRSV